MNRRKFLTYSALLGGATVAGGEIAYPAINTRNTPLVQGKASELKADAMIKKLSDAAPTMIELKLKLKGYESDFKIPIALKANPHFLRSDELAALFDSAIEDKRLLTRIVKLTSGEISFFKDFLFNIDRIKRDQKLYESFGQHPWYQQFMARKEKNRAKRLGLILSSLFGCICNLELSSYSFYRSHSR